MMTDSPTIISRLLNFFRNTCVAVSSISLIVIVVTFAYLVWGRYIINDTPTWVEQLALVLICYITFLGAAAGVHDDTHLGVDFIRESLPAKPRFIVHLFADLMVAILGAIMFVAASELVQFGWSTKLPMLDIPEGVRTLPMAICGALMFLFSCHRLITAIKRGSYPKKPQLDEIIAGGDH